MDMESFSSLVGKWALRFMVIYTVSLTVIGIRELVLSVDPIINYCKAEARFQGQLAKVENYWKINPFLRDKDKQEELLQKVRAARGKRDELRDGLKESGRWPVVCDEKQIVELASQGSIPSRAFNWTIVALLTPLLLMTFAYYFLAPRIAAAGPLRLEVPRLPRNADDALTVPAVLSAPTVSVPLQSGCELVIHANFLRAIPNNCVMESKGLLDPAAPLSCLAAGLFGLSRLRPIGSENAVVSLANLGQTDDELGLLQLKPLHRIVISPRYIAGVSQVCNHPIRISKHWRLGSLHAWLTWQFRYFVFEGPGTLVIRGCRGIRVDAASSGCNVPRAAVIGFTPSLTYRSVRAASFVAFVMGKQDLLLDRFDEGEGYVITEAVPRTLQGSGKGLQGVLDVVLKAIGI
jgi:hypothetical protein